jgi:creatinine amidohydrolase/Fe(II)-dependent formamide hydrolase-like protein
MAQPVRFEELTLDEAVSMAQTRGIMLVPAATTEGHGYHLPLATDTLVAEHITAELSRITQLPALLPTPIRCGCSPTFHYDLNGTPLVGTLAIGHDTMHHLVKDLCRGLWSTGFRKVIFIQGHGQEWNFQTIAHEVATELRRENKPLFMAGITYWELCAETIRQTISAPFWHAGEHETSAVLAIRPDLVKMDAATGQVRVPLIDSTLIKKSVAQDDSEALAVQDVASWVPIPHPHEVHPSGVGTTEQIKSATADKGKKVLDRAIDRYLALLRDLELYYAPQEVPGVDIRERPLEPRFKVTY